MNVCHPVPTTLRRRTRSRWRAAGFAVLLALAPAALASQGTAAPRRIDQRLPLSRTGLVKVFNYAGAVHIVGWAKDTVAVTGTLTTPHQFFMGGSASGIKLGLEGDAATAGTGAELTVSVPMGARVWVRTSSASVEVEGLTGAVDVGTVEGAVRVSGSGTDYAIESMAGDIQVTGSPAYLRTKSAGGRITWSGTSEDVALSTVSGAIVATAGVVTRARFESVTGPIRYTGGIVRGGTLTLDSHAGDVSAAISRLATAELEVDAPVSDVLGTRTARGTGDVRRVPITRTIGQESFPSARITLRSFKGRATVTQP